MSQQGPPSWTPPPQPGWTDPPPPGPGWSPPPAPVDPAFARWGRGWAPPRRPSNRLIAAIVLVAAIVLLVVPISCAVWLAGTLGSLGTPVLDLQVGQCFNGGARPGATSESFVYFVEVVECAVPHENELIAIFDYPADAGAPYPGVNELAGYGERECAGRFAAYVGLPIDRASLYLTSLYPTEQGWRVGDRLIQCIVLPPIEEETSTGSVRDSHR
jgi:putative regulator of septum formation